MLKKLFQNARKPQGLAGRMMVSSMNTGHIPLAKWAFQFIQFREDMQVLDIGCGGGANITHMLTRWPGGRVDGVDYSADSVAVSRKKNQGALGKNCEIIQGDVTALPYGEAEYDLITAFETVYFWPDLTETFKKIRTILKDRGNFVIACEMADPSNTVWSNMIDGMTVYSGEQLEDHLLKAGFTSVKAESTNKHWVCLVASK